MNKQYGLLNQPNVILQRKYFNEMVNLRGIFCKYQYPIAKQYTLQSELDTAYSEPEIVGCIFNENVDQKTTHKLGWNAESDTSATIISVPYDLKNLQIGALFEIPSAFDDAPGRLFRVVEMSTIAVYPASVTCRLVPEYESTVAKAEIEFFNNSDFNLLNQEDEEHFIYESI